MVGLSSCRWPVLIDDTGGEGVEIMAACVELKLGSSDVQTVCKSSQLACRAISLRSRQKLEAKRFMRGRLASPDP